MHNSTSVFPFEKSFMTTRSSKRFIYSSWYKSCRRFL